MGYFDNVSMVKEMVEREAIEITVEGGNVVFSGNTYKVKDFLKKELGVKWDRDEKVWTVKAKDLSDGKVSLIADFLGCDKAYTTDPWEGEPENVATVEAIEAAVAA